MSPPLATLERLREIIARDFEVDPQLIKVDARLKDFAIDSLGVIEIMFAIEEEFRITVPPEPLNQRTSINTLGDLVRYVDSLVSEQRGVNESHEALP